MNRRLILYIIGAAITVALIGGLLAIVVRKQNSRNPEPVKTEGIVKITDERVVAPIPSFDGSAIWYFNPDGRLFRISSDGKTLTESALPTQGGTFKTAMWPRTGSDFLITSLNGISEFKSYYNDSQKLYLNLPANIQNIDWLPDSKRVVYIWKSSDNVHQTLVLANADGTGFRNIKEVFWSDLVVKASPDGKNVLMYRPTTEGDVNKIYLANLETGEISTVIGQGKNIEASWVGSGNRFVYAQLGLTAYPKLFVYDFSTKNSIDLELQTTIDKIVVDKDGKYLYAAVPKKDNTGDNFVKLDLTTFKQELYFTPVSSVQARNLILVGSTVYFVNSLDGKLYTINK